MNPNSTCRCLVCGLERSLLEQLAEDIPRERYRRFADSHALLSDFPVVPDLLAYLHTARSSNGNHRADEILAKLFQALVMDNSDATLRDLLLLAFIPTLHATCRQVACRYPSLSSGDITQHTVAALLQIFGIPEFHTRGTHVAFAISRILKRQAFEWAERECRSPLHGAVSDIFRDTPSASDAEQTIERAALLRHFLDRCLQRGLLTGEDLALLVEFKLDASRDATPGGPAALYSNATRQRMKRLLQKLRRFASTTRNGNGRTRDASYIRLREK
jgi:hypothetical protein